MAYVRKTHNEYYILVNYGEGWEHECTEMTWKEAKEQRKTYRENAPEYAVKIKTVRVKNSPLTN